MSGVKRYIVGEIDPKLKGKAYDNAITKALSPESIATCNPEEESESKEQESSEHSKGMELAE